MEEASEFPALITVGKSVLNDPGRASVPGDRALLWPSSGQVTPDRAAVATTAV
jgi:hypothetical protein